MSQADVDTVFSLQMPERFSRSDFNFKLSSLGNCIGGRITCCTACILLFYKLSMFTLVGRVIYLCKH